MDRALGLQAESRDGGDEARKAPGVELEGREGEEIVISRGGEVGGDKD